MDKLHNSCEECTDELDAIVKGQIPDWIDGSLIRIGPGKWDFKDGFTLNHWLDGSALLCKFTIKNGKCTFKSKFLESDAYKKLITVNRPVFTEFGTKKYPDPCKNIFARFFNQLVPSDLTDNDLAGIFKVEDEYYVATETCNVWRFDPNSLGAIEKVNLDKLVGVNLASSHYHTVDEENMTYNLGSSFMTGMKYHVVKIPTKKNLDTKYSNIKEPGETVFEKASILTTIPSAWKTCMSYYHSYAMTQNYIVFVEQPMLVNGFKLATCTPKGLPMHDCFEWHPEEKTRIYLINKHTGEIHYKFHANTFFHFHHINSYEDEIDGHKFIVCDLVSYEDPSLFDKWYLKKIRNNEWDDSSPPKPIRFVIPLIDQNEIKKFKEGDNLLNFSNSANQFKAQANVNRKHEIWLEPESLGEPGFEIPTINYKYFNGKKYRFCYASGVFNGGFYANSCLKLDVETKQSIVWRESETSFPGECVFIQKPGTTEEDEGVLLSIVLESDYNKPHFLLILDAKSFTEIARAEIPRLKGQIPPTIHGIFN